MTARQVHSARQWRRVHGSKERHYWIPGVPGWDRCELIAACGGWGAAGSDLHPNEPLVPKCERCVRLVIEAEL